MRRLHLASFGLLLAAAAVGLLSAGPSRTEAPAGKKIAGFSLKDAAGKPVALADFKDRKAVVVLFLGTECPINNNYMPRLAELHKEYDAKGVQFLAVNSNTQDSAERIAEHAKKHAIPFPVLKDADAAVADQFGAQRTPTAFLLDPAGMIRYQGRIDDQYGIGFVRPKATRRDLVEAVEEVLADKAVSRPTTPVAGCLIGRAVKPKAEAQVSFAKHVAPILQKHCQECHRPGNIGPMALLTHADASAWSAMIQEVVSENRMPPWHADPKFGKFANDRSLPADERATLLKWIDQGCPSGDLNELPKPREFASNEWTIGKPDVVFEMPSAFTVPASAGKGGIPYKYYIVPTNFKEDRWVQAVEAKAGNRAVVHHILVYARTLAKGDRADGIGDGLLATQAPGELPTILPPGAAKKIPKGAALVFQMHYTPNGVEQSDRSSVGIIFAKEPPKQEVKTRAIANNRISIPANDANYQATSRTTFTEDSLLLSFLPHMHLRGKSFNYKVVYPDGKEETLLSVPKYDFAWQANYRLATPLKLPAGTRIECTAVFDNSADNPNNPDPTQPVRWGEQTWQEMLIGFVDYTVVKEREKEKE